MNTFCRLASVCLWTIVAACAADPVPPPNKGTVPRKPSTAVPSAASDFIIAKLNKIVIPVIELNDLSVDEAVDFIRFRSSELDPEPDPAKRGVSMLITRGHPAAAESTPMVKPPARINYRARKVSFLTALSEIARQAGLDVYITSGGIVLCPLGADPFPNGKADRGDVSLKLPTATPPR